MTKRRYNTIYINEKKWVLSLASALSAVVVLYMYFVTASVAQVVMRQETERAITEVSARIGQLEASYMEAQHAINEDIAVHEGYVPVAEKIFISRAPTTLSLLENR